MAEHRPAELEVQSSRSGAAGSHGPWPSATGCWGSAPHGEQGTSSLPPCCSPSLPANSAQHHWCCPPPSKNALHPTHRQSHVPSDDHPSNCPSRHMAQLSYCCPDFQASSISALPLHRAILLLPRNHKASEQHHIDRDWGQLTPLCSFTRVMLECEREDTGASCGSKKGVREAH